MSEKDDPIKEYSEEEHLAEWPEEKLDLLAYQNWLADQQAEDEDVDF